MNNLTDSMYWLDLNAYDDNNCDGFPECDCHLCKEKELELVHDGLMTEDTEDTEDEGIDDYESEDNLMNCD